MAKSIIRKVALKTYTCAKCKEVKDEKQFYKCANNTIVPYCKECVKTMALNKSGIFDIDTVKECCKTINKPFFYKKFEEIKIKPIEERDKVNLYFKFALLHKEKTFADSDTLNVDYEYEQEARENELETPLSPMEQKEKKLNKRQLVRKWGTEIAEDIAFLEDEYEDWRESGASFGSKASRELIEQICLTKLTLRKKQKLDLPAEKELKTLQDLMGNANLKPSQEAASQAEEGVAFSLLIKHIEKDRPILPYVKPDWVDEMNTWQVGHILKAEGVSDVVVDKYNKILDKYSIDINEALEIEETEDDG